MAYIIIIYFLFSINFIFCFDLPGKNNSKYKIGNYYGSRYQSLSLFKSFIEDSPSIVIWSNGFCLKRDDFSIMWLADPLDHTIKQIKNRQSMNANYRDGDALNTLLNKPSALVHYKASSFPSNETIKYQPFLFKNKTFECLFANYKNYTNCTTDNGSNYEDIDNKFVKLIYFPKKENFTSFDNSSNTSSITSEYVFVSDKGNNCIRQIDITTAEVTTYAGVCDPKSNGFKDGPLGQNRFNQPDGIGIDDDGNLFVHDSGNNYMRMITTDKYVYTLINGACFEYSMNPILPNPFNFKSSYLLCLKNWIKKDGKPDQHIFINSQTNICYKNFYECVKNSPMVRERK